MDACLGDRQFVIPKPTIDALQAAVGARDFIRNMETSHIFELMRKAHTLPRDRSCTFIFVRTRYEYINIVRRHTSPLPVSLYLWSKNGSGEYDEDREPTKAYQGIKCRRMYVPAQATRPNVVEPADRATQKES